MQVEEMEDAVVKELKGIVNKFNEDFGAWLEETGCLARFGWGYSADGKKYLDVAGVERVLYSKPPPDGEKLRKALSMQEALEKGESVK